MIFIGSDHGGYELKEQIKDYLSGKGEEVKDIGCFSKDSVDYPDIAKELAEEVVKTKGKGILICGTGIGISIAANKVKGARAAQCHDEFTAKMSRAHNDANILCIGGRVVKLDLAKRITDTFLSTDFDGDKEEGARHRTRVEKIHSLE